MHGARICAPLLLAVFTTRLQPGAAAAWDRYIERAELRQSALPILEVVGESPSLMDLNPDGGNAGEDIPNGYIHHWIGALAIPGVGPFIAAGPIMGALAGLGVGGAVGGLLGALVGMGIPEYEAKRYEGRVKDGGVLLSVHCDTSEQIARAKDVLKQTGAEDIASTSEEAVPAHKA